MGPSRFRPPGNAGSVGAMNQTGARGHKPRGKRSIAAAAAHVMKDTPGPKLLPLEVRAMLQRAAQTPIPWGDPYARTKAVDAAIARARQMHPECFRPEASLPA
jgi:hypothetical protein